MIVQNINVKKIHGEFVSNNIDPFPVFELENGDGDFTFPEGTDMTKVQQIIDAHDPTQLPIVNADDILKSKIELTTINTLIDLGVI